MHHPCHQTFALRLKPQPSGDLAGEVEHVLSGERRAFYTGADLLRALRALQRLPPAAGGPAPG